MSLDAESVAVGEDLFGTGTMSRPVPFNTTTCVLSTVQVSQAPWRYWRASKLLPEAT